MNKRGLIASILLGTLAQAQEEGATAVPKNDRPIGGVLVESAEFNLRYLPELDQVEFTVTMQENSWFGLALGSTNMEKGTDIVTFHRYFE